MASYQSAPSSRILALTLLAAASMAACGDEAGPAAPKLFIYGPGGYASYPDDAIKPTEIAVQTYEGTALLQYTPSDYPANAAGSLTLPSIDLSGNTWMSVEGFNADGTLWLGSSPLMSVDGATVPGTIPVFTGPPNRFFPGYEVGYGDNFDPISVTTDGNLAARTSQFAESAGRAGAAVAQAPAGKGYYVVGGASYSAGALSNLSANIEWYDPYDGRFKLVTEKGCEGEPVDCAVKLDSPRAFHSANIISGGRLFVAGGLTSGASGPEATASIEVFKVSGATAERVNSGVPFELLTPRAFHTATLFDDGSLLFVGGFSGSTADPGTFPTLLEFWDPRNASDMQESATPLNKARAMHSASFVPQRGHGLLVVGGRTKNEVVSDAAIIYKQKNADDFSIQSWSVGSCAAGSSLCRWGHTATLVKCSEEMPRVMFTGGYAAIGTGANSLLVGASPIGTIGIFNTGWLLASAPAPADYTRNAVLAADSGLATGFGSTAAFALQNIVDDTPVIDFVAAGGIDASGNPVATGRRISVDYGSCEPTSAVAADLTTPRAFATGLRNEGQALIFVGGAGGGTGAADWFYGDNFKFATN
jgi:hypothetical protein